MKKSKLLKFFALLLAFMLMLTSFTSCTKETEQKQVEEQLEETGQKQEEEAAETAKEPKVLVIGDSNPPGDINPLIGLNITSQYISISTYDTLVGRSSMLSDEGELIEEPDVFVGRLAESWDISEDGLEYIFNLRKGVKFHDNSDFDADDVEYTVEMLKTNGSYASFFGELISKVEIIDPYKVKIVLSRIETQFLKRISSYNGSILSKETVTEKGGSDVENQMQWLASNEAGTGPYKLEYLTTDEAHLVANDNYWGDKPKIDKVILKTVAESSNLRIMLEKGDIDFYRLPAAIDYAALEANPDIELLVRPANSKVVYIGLNTENKPLDNPKVRQAIAYAIPYDQLCKVIGGGDKYSPRAKSLLTSELSGSEPVFEYEYDLEKAKELLKEAGYENGFKIEFDLFNGGKFPDIAVILQSELKKIGIDMEINPMAPPAFFQSGDAGNLNFFIVSWWDNAADPVGLLNDIVHSSSIPSPGNYAKYSNKDLDSLIDEAKIEMDPAKRNVLLKEAQEILAEDVPYIPVYEAKIVLAFRKDVKNYVHYSDSITRLYEMDIE